MFALYKRSTESTLSSQMIEHSLYFVTALLTVWLYSLTSANFLGNDGSQYLSTMDAILAGQGVRTTNLYYEVQFEQGLPALQTVWPPLLPVLSAAIAGLTGLSSIRAIGLLNALAHAGLGLMMYHLVARWISPVAGLIAALCFLLYPISWTYVRAGNSEPLYMFMTIASAACLYRAMQSTRPSRGWLIAASVCVGLSAATRYQGIALIAALGAVAVLQVINGPRRRDAYVDGLCLLVPASGMVAMMLGRNLLLTGRLTGGASSTQGMSFAELFFQTKWAIIGIFGSGSSNVWRIAVALALVLSAGFIVAVVFRSLRSRLAIETGRLVVAIFAGISVVASITLVYALALGKTGVSIDPRYLIALIPLGVVCLAALSVPRQDAAPTSGLQLALAAKGVLGAAAAVLFGFAVAEFHLFTVNGGMAAAIGRTLETQRNGISLAALLKTDATMSAPIMSNQSQILHAVLRQPTLGVPERRLTNRVWHRPICGNWHNSSPSGISSFLIGFGSVTRAARMISFGNLARHPQRGWSRSIRTPT
jgi:hypothetical protein